MFPSRKLGRDQLACAGFVRKAGRPNEKTGAKCFAPVSSIHLKVLNRPTQKGGLLFNLARTGEFQPCVALLALEVQADHFARLVFEGIDEDRVLALKAPPEEFLGKRIFDPLLDSTS